MKPSLRYFAAALFTLTGSFLVAQDNVPLGIHYQAVARDNYGNELVNRKISVRFSIIKDNPLGTVMYQELHQDIMTSRFGVFSLIIGQGTPTGSAPCGELSQVSWESAYHFLKVEVKFENDFMDMGTMQFLAVPYALYARKSLEPGTEGPRGDPEPAGVTGPKGDPGDPATDDDPKNELQDITISSDKLKITNNALATEWDLSPYRQSLLWDPAARILSISGTNSTVNLSELKDDADADATNEIQSLSYDPNNFQLTIDNGGTAAIIGQIIAFRAGVSTTVSLPDNTPVDLIFDKITGINYYNEGGYYNNISGGFLTPYNGIYSFTVSVNLPINSSIIIKVLGTNFETIIGPTTSNGSFKGNVTMKLNKNDLINLSILQTNGYTIPSYSINGYFSGYRVY